VCPAVHIAISSPVSSRTRNRPPVPSPSRADHSGSSVGSGHTPPSSAAAHTGQQEARNRPPGRTDPRGHRTVPWGDPH